MKVLLVLDHAPEYREEFLSSLASYVDLTVLAQPCGNINLTPPETRKGYFYKEYKCFTKLPFHFNHFVIRELLDSKYDVKCCSFNLRYFDRLFAYILQRSNCNWCWRGHIFGRNRQSFLHLARYLFLYRSKILTYDSLTQNKCRNIYQANALSFNNSSVSIHDFKSSKQTFSGSSLNLLFVGRNQPRKKLHRLINLALELEFLHIKLIGPNMFQLLNHIPNHIKSRVQVYDAIHKDKLDPYFDWCHCVINPGHVGLLVMTSAKYQKPIIIDKHSSHAPEYLLALESEQPFLDLSSAGELQSFHKVISSDPSILINLGSKLAITAKSKFTIEYMVQAHTSMFNTLKK